MKKFNLTIIKPKYKKNIPIADLKQHLVNEFDLNKTLQNQVYELEDKITKASEFEIKYNLSLVTLEEYKNRIKQKNDREQQLQENIKNLKEEIKKLNYELNDLIIKDKNREKYIKNIEKNLRKEISKNLEEQIKQLKGHIKKDDILKMLKKVGEE